VLKRFRTTIAVDSKKRLYLPFPFDPDAEWGKRPRHHVRGDIGPVKTRGALQRFDGAWGLRLNPLSRAACELGAGDTVDVKLWPEGPQMDDLAPDIMVALTAEPQAQAAFQGLATFYRKGWLTWINGTKRRPDERARRIGEMVTLVKAGAKQRPR
jgi:hypothetical protein